MLLSVCIHTIQVDLLLFKVTIQSDYVCALYDKKKKFGDYFISIAN